MSAWRSGTAFLPTNRLASRVRHAITPEVMSNAASRQPSASGWLEQRGQPVRCQADIEAIDDLLVDNRTLGRYVGFPVTGPMKKSDKVSRR